MAELSGYLNVYKEKGLTSHDVVYKVRQILKTKKIGHTGTLDPNAEGVLVLCIGKATKMVQYLSDLDKVYEAEIIFGKETDTCDITGQVTEEKKADFTDQAFLNALSRFKGETMQVPPIYSALKVNGKKLYQYARAGETIDIPARSIFIKQLNAIETTHLPNRARFVVECSKGTYIRSLCRDIGKTLSTSACMGNLKRLRVGDFRIEYALRLSEINDLMAVERIDNVIMSPESALEHFRSVSSNDQGSRFLRTGNKLYQWNAIENYSDFEHEEILRLYDSGEFMGIGRFCLEKDSYVQP
ncbi:MAG: tRNA pseudouridine(55) synthase TruB, partial [Eubacterium sp.]